jgi:hypothetical protein
MLLISLVYLACLAFSETAVFFTKA